MSWINGFFDPQWLVYDNKNNFIYVSNRSNGTISKVDCTNGNTEYDWISGLSSPYGLAVCDDYLYIADMNASSIVQVNIKEGSIENIEWASISPSLPLHISILNNIMFVSCPNSNTICKIQIDSHCKADIIEKDWIPKSAGLKRPIGLVTDNNKYLYISNNDNNAISKIDIFTGEIDIYWIVSNLLDHPNGMCIMDKYIYIANKNFGTICQINIVNKSITNSEWACQMQTPISVIHDNSNTIFASSNGASTSSSKQNGAGFKRNSENTKAIAVKAFSPPERR